MTNKSQSVSAEDYLKAIYRLSHASGVHAPTKRIAEELAVTAPSVTGMLKKLESRGLVHYSPYTGATLSRKGHARAMKVLRRHRLVELFLQKCLNMSWDEVHDEAEVLEHALSDKLERRIADWLGDPSFDPHGAPIPDESGRIVERQLVALTEIEAGCTAVVAEVRGNDATMLSYFKDHGVLPNRRITLLDRGAYGGSLKLRISRKTRYVGRDAAANVMVEVIDES